MVQEKSSQLLSMAKSVPFPKTGQKKTSKNLSESKTEEYFAQDLIPIEEIQAGMIFMKDGSVVKILEIIPLNYYEKDSIDRDRIADGFGSSFKVFPNNGHIKMMNTKTDLRDFERHIREATKNDTDPSFLERVEDYIENIRSLQKDNSIKKRFFFIFSYEGDENGKKSDDINEIYSSMMQTQTEIANSFRALGHVVIQTSTENLPLVNILYDYFNPKSKDESPLSDRIEHLKKASAEIASATGQRAIPSSVDYVAPRGIRMGRWNYMVMDGVYHMFFCLTDTSYPYNTYAGWLNLIQNQMPDCDIDIYYRKNQMPVTGFVLDRYSILNRGLAHSASGNREKQMKLINNFNTKKYPNPHYSLIGTTGAGKTYTECMLSSRMRMRGIKTMFILPIKGHEYKDAITSMGGSFISLRPGGKACLNIMELRPEGNIRTSEIEDSDIQKELEQKPSIVAKQTVNVITWVRMLMGDDRLTVEEVSELDTCIRSVYTRFGFTDDNDSIWADKEKRTRKTMPIIGDLYEEIKKNPKIHRILSVLKPWVYGNCANMNAQTNVDIENNTIAFDINEDYIGEDLLPAFMLIAYLVCYDIAKADEYEMCAIFLDEIWKMLAIPACAKQIYKMIKILRGYGTCLVAATQDIEDCMKNEWGRTIMTNSAIKIFLRVTKEEIKFLGDSIDLSPENKNLIQQLPQGTGFVCFNSERILVNFKSSLLEGELYTTDINKKREIRERRLMQKRMQSSHNP